MILYLKYAKEKIKIADKPFAGGGEGNLFKILSPSEYKNSVAKLYHPFKLNSQRFEKIEFLYNNPPDNAEIGGHKTFIWVEDILLNEQKEFVGLIMPFIRGEKLEVLTGPKLPKHLGSEWKRFDLKNEDAFQLRLKLCFNLAAAVYRVHSTEKYILVDLKPDNVVVQSNGLLSLVDMDSVEVVENGLVKFPAPVSTPEYTPPEFYFQARNHEHDAIDLHWDLFSMSVIFYRLLFGIHPYAASSKQPYDQLVSLHDKIREGFFVHNPEKTATFSVIPPPHESFSKISPELQELFLRTFAEGHDIPAMRPVAEEWCIELLNVFGDESMKLHFQKMMLMSAGAVSRFKSPSQITPYPKQVLTQRELLPSDYLMLLNFQIPEVNIITPNPIYKASKKAKYSIWPTSISFAIFTLLLFGLFLIFPITKEWFFEGLWTYEIWQIVIILQFLFLIPYFIMPYTYRKYLVQYFDKNFIGWKRKILDLRFTKKLLNKGVSVFGSIRHEISALLQVEIAEIQTLFEDFLKVRNESFTAWLKEQDRVFENMLQSEKTATAAVEKPFFDSMRADPIFSKYSSADDFSSLRTLLKSELDVKLSALHADPKVKETELSHETRTELNSQINKIESERKQYLQKINEDYKLLLSQRKEDEAAIGSTYTKEGNVLKNYRKYLKNYAGNHKLIASNLEKAGLSNVNQIESINHLKCVVYLKNGSSIVLENITDSGAISLAAKLEDWMIEVSKLQQKAEDEVLKVQKTYENMYLDLKKDEQEAMKIFDGRIEEIKANVSQLQLEIIKEKVIDTYKLLFSKLDEAESSAKTKLLDTVENFSRQYDSLRDACKKALEKEFQEISDFKAAQKIKIESILKDGKMEIKKNRALTELNKIEENLQKAAELMKQLKLKV